jgi:hypothetical protein
MKNVFALAEVVFPALHISAKGIRPTEGSQKIIQEFRRPHDGTELRSFLGPVNLSARFIPNQSTISEPLRKLTRSTEQFTWGPEQEETFALLKQKISSAKFLRFFDRIAPTIVIADASQLRLAAILLHQQEDGP